MPKYFVIIENKLETTAELSSAQPMGQYPLVLAKHQKRGCSIKSVCRFADFDIGPIYQLSQSILSRFAINTSWSKEEEEEELVKRFSLQRLL